VDGSNNHRICGGLAGIQVDDQQILIQMNHTGLWPETPYQTIFGLPTSGKGGFADLRGLIIGGKHDRNIESAEDD